MVGKRKISLSLSVFSISLFLLILFAQHASAELTTIEKELELGPASGVELVSLRFYGQLTSRSEDAEYITYEVERVAGSTMNVLVTYRPERAGLGEIIEKLLGGRENFAYILVKSVKIPKILFQKAFVEGRDSEGYFLVMKDQPLARSGFSGAIYFSGKKLESALDKVSAGDKKKFEEDKLLFEKEARVIFGIDSLAIGTVAKIDLQPSCGKLTVKLKPEKSSDGKFVKFDAGKRLIPVKVDYYLAGEKKTNVILINSFTVPNEDEEGKPLSESDVKKFLITVTP